MNLVDGFRGVIKPLHSISPTIFTALKACPLKGAWSLSGNSPLLPLSPRARVGTIVHRLLAEAGKGYLQPAAGAVEARWEELVAQVESEMRDSWIDRHLVPLARSVPDLEVQRICATRRAIELAEGSHALARPERKRTQVSGYGYELPVQSPDGLVQGVIDAVVPGHDGPVVRDYKSGAILEAAGPDDYQLKEAYQVQLRMYAALYANSHGEWPSRLEVVPLSGEHYEVSFDKDQCLDLVAQARHLLQQLNKTISTSPQQELEKRLASPSPKACSCCQYRPACGPYGLSSRPGDVGWPLDIKGTVSEIRQLGNSKVMLKASTPQGTVSVPGLSPGERHPALMSLTPGDHMGVFGLRRSRDKAPYGETLMTTIYKLTTPVTPGNAGQGAPKGTGGPPGTRGGSGISQKQG